MMNGKPSSQSKTIDNKCICVLQIRLMYFTQNIMNYVQIQKKKADPCEERHINHPLLQHLSFPAVLDHPFHSYFITAQQQSFDYQQTNLEHSSIKNIYSYDEPSKHARLIKSRDGPPTNTVWTDLGVIYI